MAIHTYKVEITDSRGFPPTVKWLLSVLNAYGKMTHWSIVVTEVK